MKKLFLLCLALSFFVTLYAQRMEDIIYLKDGSIVRGSIIELVPDKTIRIKIKGGSEFVYTIDQIAKYHKEPIKTEEVDNRDNGLYKGFNVEPAIFAGSEVDDDYAILGAHVLANYQINSFIAFGAGVGVRTYDFDATYIPLFGQFRVNFIKMKYSPFIDLGVGHAFSTESGSRGGTVANMSVGVARRIKNKQVRLGIFVDSFDKSHRNDDVDDDYDYFYSYDSEASICAGLKVSFSL